MVEGTSHKLEAAVANFMAKYWDVKRPNPWMVRGCNTGLRKPVVGFPDIELGARARAQWAWNRGKESKDGPFSALGVESGLVQFGGEWVTVFMAVFWKHLGEGKYQEYLGLSQGLWVPSRIVRSAQGAGMSIGEVLADEFDTEDHHGPAECNPHEFLTGGELPVKTILNRLVEATLCQAYLGPNFDPKPKEEPKKE